MDLSEVHLLADFAGNRNQVARLKSYSKMIKNDNQALPGVIF
jgi:hypothetical protein